MHKYVRVLNAGQVHAVHGFGGKEAGDGAPGQGWARCEFGRGNKSLRRQRGQDATTRVHGRMRLVPVKVPDPVAHDSRPQGTAQHCDQAAVVPSSAF